MQKFKTILVSASLILSASINPAMASVFNFTSNDGSTSSPTDMNDLEHGSYYGWSIAGDLAKKLSAEIDNGYHIASATFTYHNIYNWVKEPNDQLNTFLLSAPPPKPGKDNYTVGLYNADGTEKGKTYYTYQNTVSSVKSSSVSSYTSKGYTCTPSGTKFTCTGNITNTKATMSSTSTSKFELKSSIFKQDTVTIDGTGKELSNNLWARADQQSLDTINWGDNVEVTRIWDKEKDFSNPWHDIDGPATRANVVYNFDSELISILTTYAGDGSFGFGIDPDCHYYNDGITFEIVTEKNPVPEPGTIVLLGAGIFGLAAYGRKRVRK